MKTIGGDKCIVNN